MRRSSYHEQDYIFGQTMLTIRIRIGLTQAILAEALGVSRKTVGDWERGNSYPQFEHLNQFIAIAVQHRAFPAGREAEEVHTIWKRAHQKALIDETWLAALIARSEASPSLQFIQQTPAEAALAHRVDWDDAPAIPTFYGREREMDLLASWVVAERCRVVSVLGLGGIGKSALAISLMRQLADHFEVVIWRSLRDLPTCEELMKQLILALPSLSLNGETTSLEQHQDALLEQMRINRVLLVLDNLEAAMEEEGARWLRPEFEGFGRFLRLAVETEHQSCVLLTSREKPAVLLSMEGYQAPVRVLRLDGLDTASCVKLLAEKELRGSGPDWERLIGAYSGNPLALKMVAQTIVDLFEGEISLFLKQGEVIFGGVRDLLEEQFARLSRLEQSVLLCLAILREPSNFDELQAVLDPTVPTDRLLEALDGLYRHSLIERGQTQGSFALQSVVMQFLTAWLMTRVTA